MSRKRFPEGVEVLFVYDGCPCVDPCGHGRRGRRFPILEFVYGVVMEVVHELQAVVGHHVRLLNDRRGNRAALNPIQRFGIFVERHDGYFAVQVRPMKRVRGAGTS